MYLIINFLKEKSLLYRLVYVIGFLKTVDVVILTMGK